MNELECNCSWHFAKQQEASQDVGPNNAAAEHFTATPYPSLIRESIQNSLDVVLDKSQPLRMKFEFGKLRTKTFESFYELRSHIAGVISLYKDKAKPQYEDMLNCFDLLYNGQCVVEYIKVSDYNTKGMDYKPNDSPFHAFVRAVGLTVKEEESSGGSFGFGKAAYFLMSPIHTVLVSTMTEEGKTFFEGAASLCTHLFKDENGKMVKYQHYGYYDNQDGKQPASIPTDIPAKFRREEIGTDIYIMGVDGSTDKRYEAYDEMIKAALRHFWLAFMHNKLEVEIGDTLINADTLDELMSMHFPEMSDRYKSGDNYNPRPYYETVKNANSSKDFIQIDRVLPLLGQVSFFVWKNKEARDGIIHMRKQRMFIYRSRFYSSSYGYFGVFLCTDTYGNKLLKSIEDPSHRKWEPRRNRQQGKQIADELQAFIDESLREIFVSSESGPLGVTGLEDYLFVPEDLVGSNRDDVEDNPFFGEPSEEEQDEGTSPISIIAPPEPTFNTPNKESIGKVVTITGNQGGERMSGGELGGHKRREGKKKKKGSGGSPDITGFTPTENDNVGEFKRNLPVRYRVMAESRNGRMVHSIVIHTDFDVERGEIEIIVGGEEYDESIDIVKSSMGEISGNIVTNLKLKAQSKNVVELEFADNMKHAIKLTAYEFK